MVSKCSKRKLDTAGLLLQAPKLVILLLDYNVAALIRQSSIFIAGTIVGTGTSHQSLVSGEDDRIPGEGIEMGRIVDVRIIGTQVIPVHRAGRVENYQPGRVRFIFSSA